MSIDVGSSEPELAVGSKFLTGLLEPVPDERDDADLAVEGELPEGLHGTFMRNGPNPQFMPLAGYHIFEGDGMVHSVSLEGGSMEGGTAAYRNRYVECAGLMAERKHGRAMYPTLANFAFPPAEVVEEGGMMKNTGNTNLVRHAGTLLALMEAGAPLELTPSLETVGDYDFGGNLVGPMTAHPHVDSHTGEMFFFGYGMTPPFLRYHIVDAEGRLVHSTEIDLPAAIMMHDFMITSEHAIFFDSPAVMSLERLMNGASLTQWEPERGTRVGVMPRHGTGEEIRWFDVENCNVVHFANAFSDGNTVEIRSPRFPVMPGAFDYQDPTAAGQPYPWCWTIDLESGKVTETQTDDRSGEFPRINEAFTGYRNRYSYQVLGRDHTEDFDFSGVAKYDLEKDTAEVFEWDGNEVIGEHVFAPDPNGSAEDDGWLLGFVSDRDDRSTHLAITDARDVAAGPIAKVRMERRVPTGFHANWFPA
jgi:carotenoid cleavage dioxygenase